MNRPRLEDPSVIAVSGGKGGVGKSTLALHLGVALSRLGRRTLLIDGDMSLANLDVLLGLTPEYNVEHLLRGEVPAERLVVEGPDGLRLLPAASGVPDLADLDHGLRSRLIHSLTTALDDLDQVLIDTGAGLGRTTLALQLAASRVVIVTTPEPTSLVDAYATLKVLWASDPRKPVDLVVNGALDEAEGHAVYERLRVAAGRFLGREPGSLGAVLKDERIPEAVRAQRSVFELAPNSPAAGCFERLAQSVASTHRQLDCAGFWQRLAAVPGKEVVH